MKLIAAFLTILLPSVSQGTGPSESDVPRSGSTTCTLQFIDCTAKVLTAPLNGSFLHYCFVSNSPGNGAIQFSWKRDSGPLDWNRTVVNSSGTTYLKNISIQIGDIKEYDRDTYVLTVWNDCCTQHSSIYVDVNRDGGCFQDQSPNVTHIISSRCYYFEGEDILILCDFNGDVDLNHYDVEWNKDDQEDITNQVNPPIAKKYNSYRQNNCPVESECCSYHDILTVHDASRNDSGVYTCLAWPVVGGTPKGSSLSAHVWVAPWPQLLEQPQNAQVKQGDMVKLSCTVSGFSNVTEVLWKKNHKDIESAIDTSSGEYTTRRTNMADGVFVETLQFTAHSAAYGGSYSCCLGVKNASRDNMLAAITRMTTQPAEFDCGTLYGVVSVTTPGNARIGVFIGVAVGVAVAVVLLVGIIVMYVVNRRWQGKTEELQVLVESDTTPQSYGALDESNPTVQDTPDIPRKGTTPVYVLYALELEGFSNVTNEDNPAYNLIVDFVQLLGALGIPCCYDAEQTLATDPNTVENSVEEAQLVVVVCSEVMQEALNGTAKNTHVQMKFSKFGAQSIRTLMSKLPEKFIPVTLAGDSKVCKVETLCSQRLYDLRNFERFIQQLNGDTQGRAVALLAKMEFRELNEFLELVHSLTGHA